MKTTHCLMMIGLLGVAVECDALEVLPATLDKIEDRQVIAVDPRFVVWHADGATKVPSLVNLQEKPEAQSQGVVIQTARRESEPFQIIVSGLVDGAEVASLEFEDLALETGDAKITGDRFDVRLAGYVYGTNMDQIKYLDPLFPADSWNTVKAGENLVFWITASIPEDQAAGTYRGQIVLTIDGQPHRVPLQIDVWDFALPTETHIWTQLFMVKPRDIIYWYDVDPWSDEYGRIMRNVDEMYVRLRLSSDWPTAQIQEHLGWPARWGEQHGVHGRYASFNGRDTWILEPHRRRYSLNDRFTLMTWVRPAEVTLEQDLVGSMPRHKGGRDSRIGGYLLYIKDGQYCFETQKSGGGGPLLSHPVADDGAWHHLAGVFDRGTMTFYVDGEKVGQAQADAPTIGDQWEYHTVAVGNYGEDKAFHGDLDAVRIFNQPLEASQVREEMDSASSVSQPILAWEFETDPSRLRPVNMYTDAAFEHFERGAHFWKDHGLFLGNIRPLLDDADREGGSRFWSGYYPILDRVGLADRSYVRLPHDETYKPGRALDNNIAYARMLQRVAPQMKRHQTFGGLHGLDDQDPPLSPEAALSTYEGLIDIWDLRGDIQLRHEDASAFLDRRVDAGDELAWYLNLYSRVYNYGNVIRSFAWHMQHHRVRSMSTWGTTLWHRPSKGDASERMAAVSVWREPRGFGTSTGVGVGNGCWFWPGESDVLSSIRAETLRDAIEDLEYCHLLEQLVRKLEDQQPEAHRTLIAESRSILAVDAEVLAIHPEIRGQIPKTQDTSAIYAQRQRVAEQILRLQYALEGRAVQVETNDPAPPIEFANTQWKGKAGRSSWSSRTPAAGPELPTTGSAAGTDDRDGLKIQSLAPEAAAVAIKISAAEHSPKSSGLAIQQITASFWVRHDSGGFASGLMILQGDRCYLHPITASEESGGWQKLAAAGLRADDFARYLSDGVSDPSQQPDFTASGQAMQFGILVSQSPGDPGRILIDDFRMRLDVHPSPGPTEVSID